MTSRDDLSIPKTQHVLSALYGVIGFYKGDTTTFSAAEKVECCQTLLKLKSLMGSFNFPDHVTADYKLILDGLVDETFNGGKNIQQQIQGVEGMIKRFQRLIKFERSPYEGRAKSDNLLGVGEAVDYSNKDFLPRETQLPTPRFVRSPTRCSFSQGEENQMWSSAGPSVTPNPPPLKTKAGGLLDLFANNTAPSTSGSNIAGLALLQQLPRQQNALDLVNPSTKHAARQLDLFSRFKQPNELQPPQLLAMVPENEPGEGYCSSPEMSLFGSIDELAETSSVQSASKQPNDDPRDDPHYVDLDQLANEGGVSYYDPKAEEKSAALARKLLVECVQPKSILRKCAAPATQPGGFVKRILDEVQTYDKIGFLPLKPSSLKLVQSVMCSRVWNSETCSSTCNMSHKVKFEDFPSLSSDVVYRAVRVRLLEQERPSYDLLSSLLNALTNQGDIIKILSLLKALSYNKPEEICTQYITAFHRYVKICLGLETPEASLFLEEFLYVVRRAHCSGQKQLGTTADPVHRYHSNDTSP